MPPIVPITARVDVDPWYRRTHWGAWGGLFFLQVYDYLQHWPSTAQEWTLCVVKLAFFAFAAYNTVTGASKSATPNP